MTYFTDNYDEAVVEEYVTGRLLRIRVGSEVFKFYAHSVDKTDIAVYIGHGVLSFRIKYAIRCWARDRGVRVLKWGSDKELTKNVII